MLQHPVTEAHARETSLGDLCAVRGEHDAAVGTPATARLTSVQCVRRPPKQRRPVRAFKMGLFLDSMYMTHWHNLCR